MRVLYFARAGDLAGCREEELPCEGELSLEDFWQQVIRRHPGLEALRPQCRVASGGKYVRDRERMAADREAAVIPPVSGG